MPSTNFVTGKVQSRLLCLILCYSLVLTGMPTALHGGSSRSATPQQGGQRTTGAPSPNLPNLSTVRNRRESEPKAPRQVPAKRCRWFDLKCKQTKEKKARNHLSPDRRGVGANGERLIARADGFDLFNWRKNALGDGLSLFSFGNLLRDSKPSLDLPIGIGRNNRRSASAAPAMQSLTTNAILTARADAKYRTGTGGEDLFSGNYNWSLPIVSFPGRANHDLDLTLSYNSTMWIRVGDTMVFDPDFSPISPGFRLGLPVLSESYLNTENNKNCHQLILPSGRIVELRQISTGTYESGDSTYTRLVIDTSGFYIVKLADGTQLKYQSLAECIEIKDRNGNVITIEYAAYGLIGMIVDTLGRAIAFNYDEYNVLQSIQLKAGPVIAQFSYADNTLNTNFYDQAQLGQYNFSDGMVYPALSQVYLERDASTYTFDHTTYGQVHRIRHMPDEVNNSERSKVVYNLPLAATGYPAQSDCPRFTQRTDTAYEWNTAGVNTQFQITAPNSSEICGQVTNADGTVYKEFAWRTGWQRGLVKETQTLTGATLQKKTEAFWEQDIATSYRNNPRLVETKVVDVANGNKTRRTVIGYTSYNLPADVYEYDPDQTTLLRRTHTDYNLNTTYTSRRIIGLPSAQMLYDGANTLMSRMTYAYDEGNVELIWPGAQNHDSQNYSSAFVAGRGNLTSVRRYDVNDAGGNTFVESQTGYFMTGTPQFTRDPLGHQTNLFYNDRFSDGITYVANRPLQTHAYPTRIQDPDGHSWSIEYHFDWGGVTRTTDPKGAKSRNDYSKNGLLTKITNEINGAYTRYEYAANQYFVKSYSTLQEGQGEFYSITVFDGYNRVRATVSDHPGSTGQFRGVYRGYDTLGRQTQVSNPTEINSSWVPTGDDVAGWAWSFQTYDWQGRPLVSTNQDGSTRIAGYVGCGCAGSDVTTIQGEPTATGTPENRRTQKIWRDVLGRTIKSQILNYSGAAYSTTLTEYNVRDQATVVKTFKGDAAIGASCPLGTCEQAEIVYDGHGRPQKRYLPVYQDDNVAPPYHGNPSARSAVRQYYNDDQIQTETDPRGATATYTYNNRGLVTGISYYSPSGVSAKPSVSFSYDDAGNRTAMYDGAGSSTYGYDTLSRMIWESRTFTLSGAPSGPFTINYDYGLAGQLKMIKDPFNDQINYGYDKAGRLTSVTGAAPFGGVTDYLSGVQYRAWGALKGNRGYDERMRLTSAGSIIYQYNKANDMIFADMTTAPLYDQSFGYDHVGRLTSVSTPEIDVPSEYVLTQSNPPNGLPPNYKVRPFTVSVSYDEFGNARNSGGNYWHDIAPNLNSRPQSFDTTYVNGRAKKDDIAGKVNNNGSQIWSYNAMGQITFDTRAGYIFDAAGQMTRTETGSQIYVNYTYDGDGRQVKFDQKREDGTTELRHRIYSTVLGGLLTDISSTGQKIETRVHRFVYEQDSVRQVKAYTKPLGGNVPDTVVFEGSDPHGTRASVWDKNTNTYKTLTLAAPGTYIEDINWQGMRDRYVSNIDNQISYGQYSASQYLSSYFSNINPRNPGMGCSLDGQTVQCGKLFEGIRQGSLGRLDLFSPLGVFNGPGFTIGRTTDPDADNLNMGSLIYVGNITEQPQQPIPCGVLIPTNRDERAAWQTLMAESEMVQESLTPADIQRLNLDVVGQYGADQSGKDAYKKPNSGKVTFATAFTGMYFMLEVIQNRLNKESRFQGKSLIDVVSATYTVTDPKTKKSTKKHEFEGYPWGQNLTQASLGNNGSEPCERARAAVTAIDVFNRSGRKTISNFMNWRGVKQGDWIRPINGTKFNPTPGAVRIANTDFY